MPKGIASESFHWYTKDGFPCYEIEGKNGNLRPTTLRDARKLNLLPSVTTVLSVFPKPGLIAWKERQILLAALTSTRKENEPDDVYISSIMREAHEQAREAAEKGTAIHGAIERYLQGDVDNDYVKYAVPALNALAYSLGMSFYDLLPVISVEKSFASSLGYGGKVDLHSREINFVCDFKTKDIIDDSKPGYQEHCIQLSAYANGLNMPDARLINIYISTKIPGLVKIVEHAKEEKDHAFEIFKKSLELWRLLKKYP